MHFSADDSVTDEMSATLQRGSGIAQYCHRLPRWRISNQQAGSGEVTWYMLSSTSEDCSADAEPANATQPGVQPPCHSNVSWSWATPAGHREELHTRAAWKMETSASKGAIYLSAVLKGFFLWLLFCREMIGPREHQEKPGPRRANWPARLKLVNHVTVHITQQSPLEMSTRHTHTKERIHSTEWFKSLFWIFIVYKNIAYILL